MMLNVFMVGSRGVAFKNFTDCMVFLLLSVVLRSSKSKLKMRQAKYYPIPDHLRWMLNNKHKIEEVRLVMEEWLVCFFIIETAMCMF